MVNRAAQAAENMGSPDITQLLLHNNTNLPRAIQLSNRKGSGHGGGEGDGASTGTHTPNTMAPSTPNLGDKKGLPSGDGDVPKKDKSEPADKESKESKRKRNLS